MLYVDKKSVSVTYFIASINLYYYSIKSEMPRDHFTET